MKELSEITRAEIVGAPEEIQVNVDPYKMQAARIGFMDIENAISRENRDITGGLMEVGNMKRTIRSKATVHRCVKPAGYHCSQQCTRGASVYLKDIAEIRDTIKRKKKVMPASTEKM